MPDQRSSYPVFWTRLEQHPVQKHMKIKKKISLKKKKKPTENYWWHQIIMIHDLFMIHLMKSFELKTNKRITNREKMGSNS